MSADAEHLAASRRVADRAAAAGRPDTTPDLLDRLAGDPSAVVRRAVAQRAGSHAVLRRLATDPDRRTRQAVVENPRCPPPVLAVLADDADRPVRWSVPQHAGAGDEDLQAVLARNADATVRALLAERRDLAPATARTLAGDPVAEVRHRLAARTTDPGLVTLLVADPAPHVRAGLALNPRLPSHVAEQLSLDRTRRVRATLAETRAEHDLDR
jgi:hypothetical protein